MDTYGPKGFSTALCAVYTIDIATGSRAAVEGEEAAQRSLLRCIAGPEPNRSVVIDDSWLSSNVVLVASAIYQERAFDRLSILADALEDAGCNNVDILNHCRQPGEHVRGCWVVDLLLAKE